MYLSVPINSYERFRIRLAEAPEISQSFWKIVKDTFEKSSFVFGSSKHFYQETGKLYLTNMFLGIIVSFLDLVDIHTNWKTLML